MSINFATKLLMKPVALALMAAASFCAGVRHKRYSEQLEVASDQWQKSMAISKINGNVNIKKAMEKANQFQKILISKASICHGMKLSQKKL